MTTLMTLGNDPQASVVRGHLCWVTADPSLGLRRNARRAGGVLTLNTEGPTMANDGQTANSQDVIQFESDDRRLLTSRMLGEDEQLHQLVTTRYRRTR